MMSLDDLDITPMKAAGTAGETETVKGITRFRTASKVVTLLEEKQINHSGEHVTQLVTLLQAGVEALKTATVVAKRQFKASKAVPRVVRTPEQELRFKELEAEVKMLKAVKKL